jgi:hypothetical protein
MDSVRFGRALGVGARAAAKTLVMAVDAATAPNPTANAEQGAAKSPVLNPGTNRGVNPPVNTERADTSGARIPEPVERTAAQIKQTGQGLKQGGKQFNKAVGGRLVRLSGALWLELTGVFFGIFAVSAVAGSWRMRSALHETMGNHDSHVRLLISLTMAAVFGYFCVSSFVKANRRTKGQ